MRIRFQPVAEAELTEARLWYSLQSDGLDVVLMDRVDEVFHRIVAAPESYPVAYRYLRRALTRQFPYAIFYEVVDEEIIIFAIYHSRRDPKRLKARFSKTGPGLS